MIPARDRHPPSLLLLASLLAPLCVAACVSSDAIERDPSGVGTVVQAATIPAKGGATTLDIASWNLEWFGDTANGPTDEALQQQNVLSVVAGTDFDIWGFEEVVSASAWANLKAQLPGYAGFLANESNVINEYLDATFPDPPLVPDDAYGKAQMRMWFAFENDWAKPFRDIVYETMAKDRIRSSGLSIEQVRAEVAKRTRNEVYGRIAARLMEAPRDDALVRDRFDLVMEKIEQMEIRLADGRTWLCGDEFTLADIALVPRLEMFPVIGVSDLYQRFPHIGRFTDRFKARPSWQASLIRPEVGEAERHVAA